MNTLRYFILQTKYNIKNASALSHSFWISIISMMINNSVFFVIWLLFLHATGPINGWTGVDVFGMLGVAMVAFGVTQGFFYGMNDLPQFVVRGTFDSVLLTPTNAFIKLAGSSFSITAYGDLIQGTVIAVIYGFLKGFDAYTWLLYGVAILCGCIVFICIRLLCSLTVFFIHDGEDISRQLFEIFLRPGLYPGALFPKGFKIFFMTVIPTLITSAVPIDIVRLRSIQLVCISIVVTLVWVAITSLLFNLAIRRYESGNFLR